MALRPLSLASVIIAVAGAVATVTGFVRNIPADQRSFDAYLVLLSPFVGFAIAAVAFRSSRASSISALVGALVATALSLAWARGGSREAAPFILLIVLMQWAMLGGTALVHVVPRLFR